MKPSLLRYALHTIEGHPGHEAFWAAIEGLLTPAQKARLAEGGDIRAATWLAKQKTSMRLASWQRQVAACRPVLDLIYKFEAGGFKSPYEAYNRGRAGDSLGQPWPGGLQSLTIGQVIELQAAGALFAVGAPQLIPSTLKLLLSMSGLTAADRFDAPNQDRLTVAILLHGKRPMLACYLKGETNLDAAVDDLAFEWASLPNSKGRGWYDGDAGGNHAHARLEEVREALQAARLRLCGPSIG